MCRLVKQVSLADFTVNILNLQKEKKLIKIEDYRLVADKKKIQLNKFFFYKRLHS